MDIKKQVNEKLKLKLKIHGNKNLNPPLPKKNHHRKNTPSQKTHFQVESI